MTAPAVDSSALILLGALAMLTLPHQFHVGVVECASERHLRTARWLFPLYMLLIALPILPLARAGDALLGAARRAAPTCTCWPCRCRRATRAGADRVPWWLQRRHRHGDPGHAGADVMIGNHWLTPCWLRGAVGQGTPARAATCAAPC